MSEEEKPPVSCWGILASGASAEGSSLSPWDPADASSMISSGSSQIVFSTKAPARPQRPRTTQWSLLFIYTPQTTRESHWVLKVPSSQQLKNPKHSSARKINPHIWKEQPFERAPGILPFDKWGQARPLLLIFSPFEAQGFGIWGLHCTRKAHRPTSSAFI